MPEHISRGMHYATMAALIISNLTVLALAMLLAGPLLGNSLGEIGAMQDVAPTEVQTGAGSNP